MVDIEPLGFLLRGKKDIVIVEIGMFEGVSTEFVLETYDVKEFYTIDPFECYEGYREESITHRLKDALYDRIVDKFSKYTNLKIIRDYSHNVVEQFEDNSLDVVYLDGNHAYDYIYQDIIDWFPKVKEGGILMGDDIVVKDVQKALDDIFTGLVYDVYRGKRGWFVLKEGMFGGANKWWHER